MLGTVPLVSHPQSISIIKQYRGISYRNLYNFILKGEDRPRCVGCDEDITVKHILLDCVVISDQRPWFYSLPNLKHLFTQVPGHQILSFLKAVGLYGKF